MLFRYSIFQKYNIQHFTTTNKGGVSKGNYSTLNLCPNAQDNIDDVIENRNILSKEIGVDLINLFIPFQIHGERIEVIDKDFLNLSPEEKKLKLHGVDALITAVKNICIGITTADCVPVSIYDPQNHVLAVVHAGWKGTVSRIGGKTVSIMVQMFSSDVSKLIVGIGPSISQKMFEVGDEVGEAFRTAGFNLDTIAHRKSETGKLHINLWEANLEQLLEIGVKETNIEITGICTYQSEKFFSARRQTIKSGRMVTGGVLQ